MGVDQVGIGGGERRYLGSRRGARVRGVSDMWGSSARFTSHQLEGTASPSLEFLEYCVDLVFWRLSQHSCGRVTYEIRLGRNGNHLRGADGFATIECHETCQPVSSVRGL